MQSVSTQIGGVGSGARGALVRVPVDRVLAALVLEIVEQAEDRLLLGEEERRELLVVRQLVPGVEIQGRSHAPYEPWRVRRRVGARTACI